VSTSDLGSNPTLKSHSAAVTNTLGNLAQNIDNQGVVDVTVNIIASKHKGLSIGEADLHVSSNSAEIFSTMLCTSVIYRKLLMYSLAW
jgi:hemoglobin-like flavoprotein